MRERSICWFCRVEALFSVIDEIFLKIPNLVASLLLSLLLSVSVTSQPGCTWSHDVRKGTDVTGLSGQTGFTGKRRILGARGFTGNTDSHVQAGEAVGGRWRALHAGGAGDRGPGGIEDGR